MSSLKSTLWNFEKSILEMKQIILKLDAGTLTTKSSEKKWSKKEILGHLIDSAIHNLQRFTEVQFRSQPYLIKSYNQDELVKVNKYQKKDINDMIDLWVGLNKQILFVIIKLGYSLHEYSFLLDQNRVETLEWLFIDYVEHLGHHIEQIKS